MDIFRKSTIPHPIERMMPTIANVDTDLTELRLENWMSVITFHVISALVEVTDSRDVVLPTLTKILSSVAYDNGGVPDGITVGKISF